MSIFNLNNWFNFFTGKNKTVKTLKDNDIIAFGRKDQTSFNGFRPLGITAKDLKTDLVKNASGGSAIANPNVPIKTYCAEILQLGLGTAAQENAVIVNTFDGLVAPGQLAPFPGDDGKIKIISVDNEFTVGKTMVTITPSETNAAGVNCFVLGIGAGSINILCQDIANNLVDKNNVQILVKIEVYA